MIFTDRKITIRNGKSSIDAPVILYRGDFEVSIKFTIMESKFRFKTGVNLVDSEKASFGQLAILAPYGGNVFSEVVKCEDGTVTFTLTKEMIDQLEEVGLYSFQIRLFDYYRESRVSIPPVEFGIEVREPVASEDHDNEVNNAIVGYSIAKVVDPSKEDVGPTFDADGQYNKTDWETGDRISQGKLNKIEDAIDKINQNEKNDIAVIDKKVNTNYNVLYNEIDATNDALTTKINNKADVSYVNSKVNAVASGSPKGVYATVAALTSAIPKGNSNIYVVSADGCWYYWNGSAWTKGGVYQDTKIGDGTITTTMFSDDIQSRIRSSADGMYLQTAVGVSKSPIDIDTERKVIKIMTEGNAGGAFNGTDISGNFYSTMDDPRAVDGVVELDYSVLGTSAVLLCYDLTARQYVLKAYSQPIKDNVIRLAFIRTNRSFHAMYTDANTPLVTLNNGHPNYTMLRQIELGMISGAYFVKTIFQSNYNSDSGVYAQRKMIIDLNNKSIVIPSAEFIYGATIIQIKEPYTINWTQDTSLLYVFYNLETNLFEAYGYDTLARDTRKLVREGKLLLYDMYRVPDKRGVFTDEFATVGTSKVEYFDIKDVLNFSKKSNTKVIGMQRRADSMLNSFMQRFDDDVIIDHYRARYNEGFDVITVVGNPELNSFHANCAKITKSGDLFALSIDHRHKAFDGHTCRPALRFYAVVNDKLSLVHDTGWYTGGTTGTGDRAQFTSGNFLIINNVFRQAEKIAGQEIDTLYVVGVAQKIKNGEPANFNNPVLEGDMHFEITPIYQDEGYVRGELANKVICDDVLYKVKTTSPRWRYILPESVKGTDSIQCSSKIKSYNVDGTNYLLRLSVHYLDDKENTVFDTNWNFAYLTWPGENIDVDASIEKYWEIRYSPNGYPSKFKAYTKTAKAEIYVGVDGLPRVLTDEEQADLIKQMDITYEVHPMTDKELEEFVLPSEYKENIILGGSSGEINAVAVSNTGIYEYNASTKIALMRIAREAKGFLVEFRAKVSSDMGSITFGSSAYKMTVVNNSMKAFKMRFNKSDISELSGDITATPPAGGTITIQGLKVIPVFDEVPTSNHTNAQFYLHRGYSSAYPENTLLAVEEACKRGCTIIEIDTFSSTDNKTLMCHDYTLGRTNKEYPTRTYDDDTKFNMYSTSSIQVESTLISKFALHEQLTITDNGVDKTAYINSIDAERNILSLSINNLTGPITSIKSSGVYVGRCSEAEFLQYEVGAYMNSMFEGELNASFEDYIKVCRRYNAALLLDIRTMTEANFKGQIAQLLDKYDYWDKCYFMHSISDCNTYHQWAKDIDRKIVISPILWTSGEELTNNINSFGSTEHSNASRKDVVFQSSAVTEENVALAHSLGMRVHVFTVNSISEAQRVLRMGVDIIGGDYFSDDTAILW